jgi:periplasmic divalent cation tolerance protein
MTDKILVLSTAGSEAEAGKIAHALVERRLAACVNILPKVKSIYRWQEKIEESEEWLLVIKTTEELFSKIQDTIIELHSYDLPECISIKLDAGSADYLKWIEKSVMRP